MLQAAAVIGDFDTLCAGAPHSKLSSDNLQGCIVDDSAFNCSFEGMRKVVENLPIGIPIGPFNNSLESHYLGSSSTRRASLRQYHRALQVGELGA